jgi:hypothetical protein
MIAGLEGEVLKMEAEPDATFADAFAENCCGFLGGSGGVRP